MGKNIGGVLGAPFEGHRGELDVEFYTQDLTAGPPPNDDLDLQLVWLSAVERFGRRVDAHLLAEYWLSYVIPDWVEYGTGKANLRMGFPPPLSGYLDNPYRTSCGAFIRSEIWACLAPGHPELAARYAFEDAIVDHASEGVYAEVFCASLQSAAFAEADRLKLLEIGLSYIPEDCGVAHGVQTAVAARREGVDWKEARRRVLTEVPGSFGANMRKVREMPTDVPVGPMGYDAPSNVGIFIIGWLFGEDDFGRSLCIANNCGEDTDCTCATLGATLGILHGATAIPERWTAPLGDAIATCCINELGGCLRVPRTVSELTERVVQLTPSFLGQERYQRDPEGDQIEMAEGDDLLCDREPVYALGSAGNLKSKDPLIPDLLARSPFAVTYRFPIFTAVLDYLGEPVLRSGDRRHLRLQLFDNGVAPVQKWVTLRLHLPDCLTCPQGKTFSFLLQDLHGVSVTFDFDVALSEAPQPKVEFLIEMSIPDRATTEAIKAVFSVR